MLAPYVKAQKTDDQDAEAIAEAATRPTMRLVTLKSEEQLDLQILHRARQRLVPGRTRLTNQLRFRDDSTWEWINHHLVMLDRERAGRAASPTAP